MRSSHWGFDVQHDMRAYWWTKLFLDSHAELAEFDDHVLKRTVSLDIPHQSLPPGCDKAPVKIIADYLNHVLRFVWKLIWRRYPGLNSVDFTVDLVYTIPATWSEQGERLSREAVARAWDFKRPEDTLTVMREPDAAAETVYRNLKDDLRFGDGILICDCGGGTVDITTYVVMDCTTFNLSKITAVQGAKCGGAAIDSRLFDLLKSRLPAYTFEHLNHLIAPGSHFMTQFEGIKMVWGRKYESSTYHLPLPLRIGRSGCEIPHYNNGHFILTSEDLHALFDPVIYNIASLINSQIMAANQAYGSPVINVSILPRSPCTLAKEKDYFRKLLLWEEWHPRPTFTARFVNASKYREDSRSSFHPLSLYRSMAVANGSVLRALRRDKVLELRSPRHYGLVSALSQNARDYQLLADKVQAQAEIQWVITKGQQYRQGHTYSNDLSLWYHDGDARMMTIPIYSCELSNPPCLANTAQFKDITLVGFIVVDLMAFNLKGGVPQKDLDTGLVLYRLDCSVEFVFDAENGRLDFAVKILGQVIGKWSVGLRF
ncbi:actin-like ATPase domain-containing protein [Penicillium verhagenii]|uniref:actin-like ATPase domain-containing protein n=1 Tax=Penicillium verhagenii TaxID=1562060 RepID=UPI002545AA2F|nr:actin-like ATPase domain-containing protein [Penicillium verhagenii]KAJ5938908.1 actin-like ATPase domain-containing protein [Penicillium verhagenii]